MLAIMKTQTYEIVISHAREGVSREAILGLSRGLQAWAAQQPGFVSRTLVEAGNGTWVDIILWESEEEAKRAAENIPQSCMAQMEPLLDFSTMQMLHGTAVS